MSFLFPGAFVLGALAAVIVALYLQRPRRRALEVSTLLFWRRILEREPRRRFLGRLRAPYSLFLQLLIFLLVLLALARPDQAWLRGRHSTVIVLDARARMQAPGVFGDARPHPAHPDGVYRQEAASGRDRLSPARWFGFVAKGFVRLGHRR